MEPVGICVIISGNLNFKEIIDLELNNLIKIHSFLNCKFLSDHEKHIRIYYCTNLTFIGENFTVFLN